MDTCEDIWQLVSLFATQNRREFVCVFQHFILILLFVLLKLAG